MTPHLNGEARATVAKELRRKYETGGYSIDALAAECGRLYGQVRELLIEAGATLRKQGGTPNPANVQLGRRAAALAKDGMRWDDIAEKLGVKQQIAYHHARRWGSTT